MYTRRRSSSGSSGAFIIIMFLIIMMANNNRNSRRTVVTITSTPVVTATVAPSFNDGCEAIVSAEGGGGIVYATSLSGDVTVLKYGENIRVIGYDEDTFYPVHILYHPTTPNAGVEDGWMKKSEVKLTVANCDPSSKGNK